MILHIWFWLLWLCMFCFRFTYSVHLRTDPLSSGAVLHAHRYGRIGIGYQSAVDELPLIRSRYFGIYFLLFICSVYMAIWVRRGPVPSSDSVLYVSVLYVRGLQTCLWGMGCHCLVWYVCASLRLCPLWWPQRLMYRLSMYICICIFVWCMLCTLWDSACLSELFI